MSDQDILTYTFRNENVHYFIFDYEGNLKQINNNFFINMNLKI